MHSEWLGGMLRTADRGMNVKNEQKRRSRVFSTFLVGVGVRVRVRVRVGDRGTDWVGSTPVPSSHQEVSASWPENPHSLTYPHEDSPSLPKRHSVLKGLTLPRNKVVSRPAWLSLAQNSADVNVTPIPYLQSAGVGTGFLLSRSSITRRRD